MHPRHLAVFEYALEHQRSDEFAALWWSDRRRESGAQIQRM